MTWNDFLAYCLERNVTERDFWIFVALGVLGVVLIVWRWSVWARVRKDKTLCDAVAFSAFFYAAVITAFIAPLLLMGLVHLIQFFI